MRVDAIAARAEIAERFNAETRRSRENYPGVPVLAGGGRGDGFNAELAEAAEVFLVFLEDLSACSARSAF